MVKPVKKRFDVQITAANQPYNRTFELDSSITKVKGVLVTSNKDDLLYYRGSQKIEINSQEYFPESYESKLLMSGVNVPPKSRYYDLGEVDPGNGQIKFNYTDTDDASAVFSAYRVSLYVDCEMDDGQ